MKIPLESDHVMPMEQLSINNNGGQGYGFILYQTELPHFPKEIVMEQVLDRAQVLDVITARGRYLGQVLLPHYSLFLVYFVANYKPHLSHFWANYFLTLKVPKRYDPIPVTLLKMLEKATPL